MIGFHILKMLRCTLRTGFLNKIIVRKLIYRKAHKVICMTHLKKKLIYGIQYFSVAKWLLNFADCIFLSIALPIAPSPTSTSISKNSVQKRTRVSFKVQHIAYFRESLLGSLEVELTQDSSIHVDFCGRGWLLQLASLRSPINSLQTRDSKMLVM